MSKQSLILANGELGDTEALLQRLKAVEFTNVVAADGGHRHALSLGLQIDQIVGDLDSSGSDIPKGAELIVHPSVKDETDFELALKLVASSKPDNILLLGVLGGRIDMTLTNLALLDHPLIRTIPVEVWHGHETVRLFHSPGGKIDGRVGDRISLSPWGGDVHGIVTHNLEYPLKGESLLFWQGRGVSNTFLAEEAEIELREGSLLVVVSPSSWR